MSNTPRLLTHNNRTQPLVVWAREIGLSEAGLSKRLKSMTVADALSSPVIHRVIEVIRVDPPKMNRKASRCGGCGMLVHQPCLKCAIEGAA